MKNIFFFCLPLVVYFISCKEDDTAVSMNDMPEIDTETQAEIVSVSVTGEENDYTFSVGIKSPDTGCNQYANWWEVISEDGKLIYRRILAHSHVNEQPFTRSGGKVVIGNSQIVYVRAHMNTSKYGKKVFKGNVIDGFAASELDETFANELETSQPLPAGCAF